MPANVGSVIALYGDTVIHVLIVKIWGIGWLHHWGYMYTLHSDLLGIRVE